MQWSIIRVFSIIITAFPYVQNGSVHMHLAESAQMTVRFTVYSRTVGPQYGTYFMPPFWHVEFGGGSYILRKFMNPCCVGWFI
jgi:hypothetical protein